MILKQDDEHRSARINNPAQKKCSSHKKQVTFLQLENYLECRRIWGPLETQSDHRPPNI